MATEPVFLKILNIHVTQEHIDKGNPGKCSSCPIALAMREATAEDWEVYDDGHISSFYQNGQLPNEATAFIGNFDAALPVEPFSFEVMIDI